VPGIADLEEAARECAAPSARRKRLLVRQRIVPQSLICSIAGSAYLRNWISGTGIRPGERHADGAADNAFFVEAGVEHAPDAELVLHAERDRMDAALGADILAEQQHARVDLEFAVERAADGGDHVDPLAVGARLLMGRRRAIAVRPLPADRLHLSFVEDVAHDRLGIGDAARFGVARGLRTAPSRLCLDRSHSSSRRAPGRDRT
jgi:hypothetical protein